MLSDFNVAFSNFAKEVHNTARKSGFWDGADTRSPDCFGSKIALIHSELSEALEGYRKGNPPASHIADDSKVERFNNVEEELADAVIRIMDFSVAFGFDLAGALEAKAQYNKTRSYKHGKIM